MIYQMGEHCWKPVMCCSLQDNHDLNGVVFAVFWYGCSYKAKRWKHIYFVRFPTEIKGIHCNAICVLHSRDIFVCLFIETCGIQINLWVKPKLAIQIFKQFVGEHPFCVAIEDPRHFVCQLFFIFIFYLFNVSNKNIRLKAYRKNSFSIKRNVTWRNPKTSVLCKFS